MVSTDDARHAARAIALSGPADPALPPLMSPQAARPDAPFRALADHAALWFEPGRDVLIVTLDNLSTIDTPYPRPAWLRGRILDMGYSVLGVQSMAKDWYRNPDAEDLLRRLVSTGFFRRFHRVLFVGASMGGMGALVLARLVPGAMVLALSPQSTMAPDLVPFEHRFQWAARRTDWDGPGLRDAAGAIPDLGRVVVIYDARVIEDRLHAARLDGPNVVRVRIDHCTHEAIRVVMKCGALAPLIADVLAQGRPGPAFWRAMRARRGVRKWARAFMETVVAEGHPTRIRAVAQVLLKQDDYLFAHKALAQLETPAT